MTSLDHVPVKINDDNDNHNDNDDDKKNSLHVSKYGPLRHEKVQTDSFIIFPEYLSLDLKGPS